MRPGNVTAKSTTKVSVSRTNPPTKHRNLNKVLAERNQAVMPVGVWVEGGRDDQGEHPAVRAIITEELHEEKRREKEQSLRRFQENVRRRVAQQAHIRKSIQLHKSCDTVEREGKVLQQSNDLAQRLIPRKNLYPSSPRGEICSPISCWVKAHSHGSSDEEYSTQPADQQHTHQRSGVMGPLRHRPATCQTACEGEVVSELPGGICVVSPTTDNTAEEEEEDEYIPVTGQHNCPLGQQNIYPNEGQGNKTVTFDRNPGCKKLLRDPHPSGHCLGFGTNYRATQVLWPQEDKDELKRQRQSQFLMYRRLFMDIEREQAKEHQRHRKHLNRLARMKAEKEEKRLAEERKMEEDRLEVAEREILVLERLRMEEEKRAETVEKRERAKKDKLQSPCPGPGRSTGLHYQADHRMASMHIL